MTTPSDLSTVQGAATTASHSSREYLVRCARRCMEQVDRYAELSADHARAREILTAMAGHCRTAAAVFDIDPTLFDDPYDSGRFRVLDLLAELARQMGPLLNYACSSTGLDKRPRQDRWDEVEAMAARAAHFARLIPQAVPRRDHATMAGSWRISRDRLATRAGDLAAAALEIDAACGPARLRLPHLDPTVGELSAMADRLGQIAAELSAYHDQQRDALEVATGLAAPSIAD